MLLGLIVFLTLLTLCMLMIITVCSIFVTFYLRDILKELVKARIRAIKLMYPEEEEDEEKPPSFRITFEDEEQPQQPHGDPWYLHKLN